MPLFRWLKALFSGGRSERLTPRFSGEGICPYCGAPLRTPAALQCFECGVDWHDPNNPVRRGQTSPPSPWPAALAGSPVTQTEGEPPSRRESSLAGLDASQFAPISRGEMMLRASTVARASWLNVWFGRRDVIPPTGDPRTLMIDRAMVTQGLATPEELAEIHRLGDEMARLRPHLLQAERSADQAVQRAREDREALKRQKKQEAQERKRRRREEIEHRRRTDIVFLGRGVSRGLADRRTNVEKLTELGLPVLAAPADVAEALNVSIPRLRWLAFHNEAATRVHYIAFTAPKKSGGVRELAAPHRETARCQRWILENILAKVPTHQAAHGFVPGRSTLTNAQPHVGSEAVLNVDLVDFFPTITFPRVMGVFGQLGYSPAAATILALLCTECPRRTVEYAGQTYHVATGPRALPQGACTSPALSNLVARRLDARLSGIAAKLGWRYTRYADDCTFSAGGEAAEKLAYLMARVRHIVGEEGFLLNGKKTRVLRPSQAQTVTGVVVNQRLGAPRKLVRRLRAILHRAKSEGLTAQNRENHPHFEAWIRGMVAYVSMVNPQQGEPLARALREVIS